MRRWQAACWKARWWWSPARAAASAAISRWPWRPTARAWWSTISAPRSAARAATPARRSRSSTRSRPPAARPWPAPTAWPTGTRAERIVQCALEHFGRIDGVVNNAGIVRDRFFFNMSLDEWRAVIDVHLNGSFYVARAAAPHFRSAAVGRLRAHDLDLGADRQPRPGELLGRQAGHRRRCRSRSRSTWRAINVRSNCIAPFAWSRMTARFRPTRRSRRRASRR